jgi:hypothetical protein
MLTVQYLGKDMQFAKLAYVVKTVNYLNNLLKLHMVKIKIYLILWTGFFSHKYTSGKEEKGKKGLKNCLL